MPTTPGTRARPNANYILAIMRDDDLSDPWGTAMAWQFAVCENLAAMGSDVPYTVGYAAGAGGPVIESFEDFEVHAYLMGEDTDAPEPRIAEVERAAVCLDRYLDWCKAAGKDY
jgi:hypothetical protein